MPRPGLLPGSSKAVRPAQAMLLETTPQCLLRGEKPFHSRRSKPPWPCNSLIPDRPAASVPNRLLGRAPSLGLIPIADPWHLLTHVTKPCAYHLALPGWYAAASRGGSANGWRTLRNTETKISVWPLIPRRNRTSE